MDGTTDNTAERRIDDDFTLPYPLDTLFHPVSRIPVSNESFLLTPAPPARILPAPFVDLVSRLGLPPPISPASEGDPFAPIAYYMLLDMHRSCTLSLADPSNRETISLSESDTKLYSEVQIVTALNYGNPPFAQIAEIRRERPDLLCLSRFINRSLVEELKRRLFGLDYGCLDILQKGSKSVFAEKLQFLDDFLFHKILREIWGTLETGDLCFPYSYIFQEVYSLISFVHSSVRPDGGPAKPLSQFRSERQYDWQDIFSESLFIYSNSCIEVADDEYDWDTRAQRPAFDQLFRIYQLLRGEGRVSDTESKELEGPLPYARSAKVQIERQFRIREFQKISDGRVLFLRQFGIQEYSLIPQLLDGHLDELRASNVWSGYFRLAFTDIPAEHLKFNDFKGRPQIKILKLNHVLRLYACQRTGLTVSHLQSNIKADSKCSLCPYFISRNALLPCPLLCTGQSFREIH